MPHRPSGTVTFLFTDIEGSTKLWEEAPHAMRLALAHHDARLRQAIEAHDGLVFKTVGDAFCAAFATAPAALAAALAAQRALNDEGPTTEDRGKTEDGGRTTEDEGRGNEDGGTTEDGGRTTEDEGRGTEDGGRTTENQSQALAPSSPSSAVTLRQGISSHHSGLRGR